METTQVYTKDKDFKKSESTTSTIAIGVGIMVSLALIGYFLIIRTFALENILYLRLANIFIILGGILVGERLCASKIAHKLEYLRGLRVGIHVTLAATIPYAIFMAIYLKMDPAFMYYIQNNTSFGKYLNPLAVCIAGVVTIEGIVSGFVLTYVVMPFFKRK